LEFQKGIQTVFRGIQDGLNPKTYFMLISLMKIKNSIKENSLNLNILYLNISKQNTKKENSCVKAAITFFRVLSRNETTK
jgi:hypothetical protein